MATLTIADLDNGKRDLKTVSEVANSRAATTTTRFGEQTTTLYEAIRQIGERGDSILRNLGFMVPVAYAPGLNVAEANFTVIGPDGNIYAAQAGKVPFTTAAWDESQWYTIQNHLNDRKLLVFSSKVEADAAAATLPDGQIIYEMSARLRYEVQAGSLILQGRIDEGTANVRNVLDSGALGGGVDDTLAFLTAQGSSGFAYVPEGEWKIDGSQVDVSRLLGGPKAFLVFVNGSSSTVSTIAENMRVSQYYWQEVKPNPGSTLSQNAAPQSLGICENSSFVTQNVSSPDGSWAPTSVVRIAEYALERSTGDTWDVTTSSGATPPTAVVDLTGLGHGVGASVIVEGGKRWLYSSVSSAGAPVTGVDCNFGTGFAKIEWKGASTSTADVQYFRGLQDVFSAEVAVSADGKLLVLAGYRFLSVVRDESQAYFQTVPWCVVFDRKQVEGASDPTTVTPLASFKVDSMAPGNLGYGVGAAFSGVASDGKHVFLLNSGAQNVGQRSLSIYTVNGDFIKAMPFDGMASVDKGAFRRGVGGVACFSYEIEGLAFYKGALISCTKMNFITPSVVVSYEGKNFLPLVNNTGVSPSSFATWARTEMAATAVYDSATNYTASTGQIYHKYLTAIAVSGLYDRPKPVTGATYIDAPSALFQGFGDAGVLSDAHFFAAKYDRQLEKTFPLFEMRDNGLGRIFHAAAIQNNPGYDRASYHGRLNYDYSEGTLISGGPSVATAATLQLGNARSGSVGDRYGVMYSQGARAMLWGVNNVSYLNINPNATGTLNVGSGTYRWNTIYLTVTPNVSSDRNLKQDFDPIDERLKRVGRACRKLIQQYRLRAEVALIGEDAKLHIGFPAQDVIEEFKKENIDPFKYEIVRLDSWESMPQEKCSETGVVIQQAREAGSALSVNYDHLYGLVLASMD